MVDAYLPPLFLLLKKLRPQILEIYHQEFIENTLKPDQTPVTKADVLSHHTIINFLNKLTPDIPVISEEDEHHFVQAENFWLVDPLDGTREFLEKTDDFCINIALIKNGEPLLGIIYIIISDEYYYAVRNSGAFKKIGDNPEKKIHVKKCDPHKIITVTSRCHGKKIPGALRRGSALKFGLIAEGLADIYQREGETSFWDTAAGQCIVEEAGGVVVDTHFNPLRYNSAPPYINPHFIAVGDKFYWRKNHGK